MRAGPTLRLQPALRWGIAALCLDLFIACSSDQDGGAADGGKGGAADTADGRGSGGHEADGSRETGGNGGGTGGTHAGPGSDGGDADAGATDASAAAGSASTGGAPSSTPDAATGGRGGAAGSGAEAGPTEPGDSGSDGDASTPSEAAADAAPPGLDTSHASCGDAGVHGCPAPLILSTEPSPWAVAVDADHVYFTSSVSAGAVIRVPIGGGTEETVASDASFPTYLAVAGGNAFWVDKQQPQGQQNPGRLMQSPVIGGAALQLASSGPYTGIASVASDGSRVYYWDNYNQIYVVPVNGGAAGFVFKGIYATNIVDMVQYGPDIYYTNSGTWNTNFTVKLAGTANVDRIAITGQASPERIVSDLDYPLFQVAVDGTYVFYNDDKFIYRTGMYGGKVDRFITLPAGVASPVVDMISDGHMLYITDGKLVYRVAASGGIPEVISWGWGAVQSLALDVDNLYFADTTGGFVVQLPK
jgi:hypothetical protein